ncbi:outer membrane protein [Ferrimonas pelagia]
MRNWILLLTCGALMLPAASANWRIDETPRGAQLSRVPYVILAADHFNMADGELWGITLAPHHFDPNYPEWGYYGGFAWGGSSNVTTEAPGRAKTSRYMGRFGLSYRMLADLSLYGGVARLTDELKSTDGTSQYCTECEPVWRTEKDHRWGAEAGVRYALPGNIAIGIGYNWATDSMILTLGLH